MRSVSPTDAVLALRAGAVFIDVRSPPQHARDGLPGTRCLPLEAIQAGAVPEGLLPSEPLYLVCERGAISELAGLYLEQAGFTAVANVRGGLLALRPLF